MRKQVRRHKFREVGAKENRGPGSAIFAKRSKLFDVLDGQHGAEVLARRRDRTSH